jgi:hypothetical protein
MRPSSAPDPQRDPAHLTAPTTQVWSAFGRLLHAALPLETARQWVAQGEAYVVAPHTIRFSDTEGGRP